MADIYLARMRGIHGFEKLVVIKQIQPRLAPNRRFVEMFLDEARLAARLQHANIVNVFDVGEVAGTFFFAMEYLSGANLRLLMDSAQGQGEVVPLEHALAVGLAACQGLHYAHEWVGADGTPPNIVHCDVSPENVFMTFDGAVRLLDFGIAKAAVNLSRSDSGEVRGKFRYMSPEQACGEDVDRRSDVFSLCVVLWELTTGARLYSGRTSYEVTDAIVQRDARRPSSVRPGYPLQLEKILLRGLQRQRGARYPTAAVLQRDLEEFARSGGGASSSAALERYMKGLFPAEVAAGAAVDRDQGETFPDALVRTVNLGADAQEEPSPGVGPPWDEAPPREAELGATEDLLGARPGAGPRGSAQPARSAAALPAVRRGRGVALATTVVLAVASAAAIAVWTLARTPRAATPRPVGTELPPEALEAPPASQPETAAAAPAVAPSASMPVGAGAAVPALAGASGAGAKVARPTPGRERPAKPRGHDGAPRRGPARPTGEPLNLDSLFAP
jgi:hypothetical protein